MAAGRIPAVRDCPRRRSRRFARRQSPSGREDPTGAICRAASSSGHSTRAVASLTIATPSSPGRKLRPRTRRIPIVSRNCGSTSIARVLAPHPVRSHVEVAPRREPDLGCRFHVRQCGSPRTKQIEIRLRGWSRIAMGLQARRNPDEMAVVEAGVSGAKPLPAVDEKTGHDQQQTAHGHLCAQEYRAWRVPHAAPGWRAERPAAARRPAPPAARRRTWRRARAIPEPRFAVPLCCS